VPKGVAAQRRQVPIGLLVHGQVRFPKERQVPIGLLVPPHAPQRLGGVNALGGHGQPPIERPGLLAVAWPRDEVQVGSVQGRVAVSIEDVLAAPAAQVCLPGSHLRAAAVLAGRALPNVVHV